MYEEETSKLQNACSQERETISRLKQELESAQKTRQNRLEYDEIARKIIVYPSREEMESTLQHLQERVTALQEENETYARIGDDTRKGLESVVEQLQSLNQTIDSSIGDPSASSEQESAEPADKKSTLNPNVPSFTPQSQQEKTNASHKRQHPQDNEAHTTSQEQPESKRLRSKGGSST